MQAALARGKIRPWDQIDVAGYHAMGGHTGAHIQKLQNNPQMKEMGTQLIQQLQSLAKQGEEFSNNLQKKTAAQDIPPATQADLQLKGRKVALAEHAQQALEQHRQEQLMMAAHKTDVNTEIVKTQMGIQAHQQAHNQMLEKQQTLTKATVDQAKINLQRQQQDQAQIDKSQVPAPVQAGAGAAPQELPPDGMPIDQSTTPPDQAPPEEQL